ncbi:MAG TPA: hypothetical protein VHR43_08755 [Gemmatimonadales bacterium]|jgi:hypothetical protein|nr:hypothetical protein [Gemmatimonadales bacterium]
MKRLAVVAALALVASPLMAGSLVGQSNPFKLPKNKINNIEVSYAYAGDMQGTASRAISKDRIVSREQTTSKFFGKTTTTDSWHLFTPEATYSADLVKKTGVKQPNMLPYMEKAYDNLDGTSKQRLHQNMKDMAQMISQAFGTQALSAAEKGEIKTYAGEKCEEHSFGGFSVCSMQDAPAVPLHMQGNLLCVNFEQTATSVKKAEPPASDFEPPAGITFAEDTNLASPDSMARGFVSYLASQQLADSIAKAKAEMAKQQQQSQASATDAGGEKPRELTPEEKEQQRQACEALKNFDLGKTMANAGKSVVNEAVNEAVQEKKAEVRNDAKNKIKGLIKKPHF